MAFLSAAGILAVCLSMLIAWTRESALTIEGVQGRYFLPYLPMLLVILRNKCIVIKEKIEQYVVYGTVFLQISTMLTIFVFVMSK